MKPLQRSHFSLYNAASVLFSFTGFRIYSSGIVVQHGPAFVVRGVLVVLPHMFAVVCDEVSSSPP